MSEDFGVPNAYIIGVQKAATTSFFQYLGKHPEIYAPDFAKDFNSFFSNEALWERGLEAYGRLFLDGRDSPVILAGNVNYINSAHVMARLGVKCPSAKVMVLLREPFDRAVSSYNYARARGFEKRPWLAVVDAFLLSAQRQNESFCSKQGGFFEKGLYGSLLKTNVLPFIEAENLLVLQQEALFHSTSLVSTRLAQFLGVETCFPIELPKVNVTQDRKVSLSAAWINDRESPVRRMLAPLLRPLPGKIKYRISSAAALVKGRTILKPLSDLDLSYRRAEVEEVFTEDQVLLHDIVSRLPNQLVTQ